MLNISDPVGQGIVASLAHPGGNITGVIQDDSPEIAAKSLSGNIKRDYKVFGA
jgi:ABC-type uncharacterized transport system substrate-binding protein